MATSKNLPGVRKKGVAVKFTRKNGLTLRGKTSSTVISAPNGEWIQVKDDAGGLHKRRPSELTAI